MTNLEIQTLEAVKSASRHITTHLEYNGRIWEQRRYEIAKDLFVHYKDMDAHTAVVNADTLIKELKKAK